jgi:predicted ATP-grasp superfamily ATP-dependent carboligase
MTDISMHLILGNRALFNDIVIPCATFEAYESLTDKWRLFELANNLGLSTPRTYFVRDSKQLRAWHRDLLFPLVVKPYRSRVFSNGRWLRAGVQYADSWNELQSLVANCEYLEAHPFLLQEYIDGENQGIFALYDRGSPVVFFAHRRLREKPPSGGVAVLSESIPMNSRTRDIAEQLFTHVGWHGVSMAEFKVRHDGEPYLLEVNARFWATLQLAVDAGVDFPWLLHELAVGRTPMPIDSYRAGVRSRWLIGDVAHLLLTAARRHVNRYQTRTQHWQGLSGFMRFFDRHTRYEINRWDDPRPFMVELMQLFARQFDGRRNRRKEGDATCAPASLQ